MTRRRSRPNGMGMLDELLPGRHLTASMWIDRSAFRTHLLEEKAKHLLCRIGPFRVSKRPGRAAARPCMTSSVNLPLLEDPPPARIMLDRARVGMPGGHTSMLHRSLEIATRLGACDNLG